MIKVITKLTCDRCDATAELEGNKTFDKFELPLDWALLQLKSQILKDDSTETKAILCPACAGAILKMLTK